MLWLFMALSCMTTTRPAERTLNEDDIYRADEVVFFGLDYTHVRLIHEDGFIDRLGESRCGSLQNKYFREWNEFFVIEKKKYDLTKFFGFESYTIDQKIVSQRNNSYDTGQCLIDDESYLISNEQLEEIISHYNSETKEGLALLIVVESLNKRAVLGKFYTVFFDLKDHKILKTDYYQEAPGGERFKNYWMAPIHRGLDRTAGHYKSMRKKFR